MTKEPVPRDVMTLLIRLARKPAAPVLFCPDYSAYTARQREAQLTARARFNAAFSACAGMAKDHPDLALHWLDALKVNQPWRRVKKINVLTSAIAHRITADRQRSLF